MKNKGEIEKQVIENYEKDEQMMILVFAQWCVNQNLDPEEVYLEAYPDQSSNKALQQAVKLTVPKEEAGEIPFDTLLGVLSLFGNEDLAMTVSGKQQKLTQQER